MPTATTPALQVNRLHFAYPGQPELYGGLCLAVGPGVALLQGDTGAGKSTLLRLLAGELTAASGRCALFGHDPAPDSAAWRRRVCALDPREPAWDALTLEELMADQRARHTGLDAAAWERHVAGFGLTPHRGKPLATLSTGSRRKAGLAVALSVDCPLVLIDDATAGLDAASVAYLAQVLAELGAAAASASPPPRLLLVASSHGLEEVPDAAVIRLG